MLKNNENKEHLQIIKTTTGRGSFPGLESPVTDMNKYVFIRTYYIATLMGRSHLAQARRLFMYFMYFACFDGQTDCHRRTTDF